MDDDEKTCGHRASKRNVETRKSSPSYSIYKIWLHHSHAAKCEWAMIWAEWDDDYRFLLYHQQIESPPLLVGQFYAFESMLSFCFTEVTVCYYCSFVFTLINPCYCLISSPFPSSLSLKEGLASF